MKILQLFQGIGHGGDAAVALDLHRQYLSAGQNAQIFGLSPTPEVLRKRAEIFGVEITLVSHWSEVPTQTLTSADVVHLHTAGEYLNYAPNVKPLKGRVDKNRFFGTVHGPSPLDKEIRTFRHMMSATISARAVKNIIVPSQHKVREWNACLPLVKNVHRIANPVKPLETVGKAEARKILGLPENAVIAFFVGLFRPEKGAMTILEAATMLTDTRIHFAFAGSGSEESACKEFAAQHGIPSTFLGYLIRPGLALSAADYFIFPSTHENFPISLMQAAAAEVPIIGSDIPVVVDEFAGLGALEIFRAGSSESLAQAIRNIIERPNLQASATELGNRMKQYTPDIVLDLHLKLFSGQ